MPRWLSARKYLASVDLSEVLGNGIALSWRRDVAENRADGSGPRDIIVLKSHRSTREGEGRAFPSSLACRGRRACNSKQKHAAPRSFRVEPSSRVTKRSRVVTLDANYMIAQNAKSARNDEEHFSLSAFPPPRGEGKIIWPPPCWAIAKRSTGCMVHPEAQPLTKRLSSRRTWLLDPRVRTNRSLLLLSRLTSGRAPRCNQLQATFAHVRRYGVSDVPSFSKKRYH